MQRRERGKGPSHQVRDSVAILEHPINHQSGISAGNQMIGCPDVRQHNHVQKTGLVLQVEENDARRRPGTLTMGDDASNPDDYPVTETKTDISVVSAYPTRTSTSMV